MEVGYTADGKGGRKVNAKETYYEPLMLALRRAGWKATLHTMVLGSTGVVYKQNERTG